MKKEKMNFPNIFLKKLLKSFERQYGQASGNSEEPSPEAVFKDLAPYSVISNDLLNFEHISYH